MATKRPKLKATGKDNRHCCVRLCRDETSHAHSRYCKNHADAWIKNGWREAYTHASPYTKKIDILTRFEFHPDERP